MIVCMISSISLNIIRFIIIIIIIAAICLPMPCMDGWMGARIGISATGLPAASHGHACQSWHDALHARWINTHAAVRMTCARSRW